CKVDKEVKLLDTSFVPLYLPNPSPHPCDNPTIIVEIAKSETFIHAQEKVNFYLSPNYAKDVILFIWKNGQVFILFY
ncbi:hypothetical protein BC937DRAFT_90409, partial [Endogone sp. FLAS-F59071]